MNEAQILQTLFISLSAHFTQGLEAAKPQWREVAMEVPSTGSANHYGWMADLPGIKEWIGDRQLATLKKHGYAIDNKTWESSIAIKREDVDDDQIGIYAPIAGKFGEDVALFPDELVYGLLPAGFTQLCFDGQPFFDTDHPVGDGTKVYSNVVGNPTTDKGSPWFLLDTGKTIRPIVYQLRRAFRFKNMNPNEEYAWFNNKLACGTDGRCNVGFGLPQLAIGSKAPLTLANYEDAVKKMGSMKKANGTPLGVRHTTLVVGTPNRAAALKLLNTQLINGGDSNPYYKDAEIVVTPYIA